MWIKTKSSLTLGALAALLSFAMRPVPYRYVSVHDGGQSWQESSPNTPGARILLGTSSHILPLVRAINWVTNPMKRWLVPLADDLDALKQEAIARVGHDDFGKLADWEALDRLLEVCEEQCHLLGRLTTKDMVRKILATNLKIQRLLAEHPEIEKETIENPILLLSFTRTGATFLYQVLADVYQRELTPTYSYEIFGEPLKVDADDQDDGRIQEAQLSLGAMGVVNPPMKLLHEWIAPDEPEDEPGWYQHTLMGLVIPFSFPSEWHHAKIYEPSSQLRNLRLWETLNKIRQWQAGGQKLRFLMKAPEHLFGFPQVAQAYPNATFVSVSRDEESWYPSSLVITHLFRQMFIKDVRVEDTIAFNDRLLCGQRRALQVAHDSSNDNTILPVEFGKYLFTHTMDIVEEIALHASLPWDDQTKVRAEEVIRKRLSWKKGKAHYKLDDFALSKELIAERVAPICDNLPPVEL